MTFEAVKFFLFGDIKNFDLSVAVAECDLIIITEGNRANVIVDLAGLIDSVDVR